MTMSGKIPKINVNLTRIFSPNEFWIKLPIGDSSDDPFSYNSNNHGQRQQTNREYLHWNKSVTFDFIQYHFNIRKVSN